MVVNVYFTVGLGLGAFSPTTLDVLYLIPMKKGPLPPENVTVTVPVTGF